MMRDSKEQQPKNNKKLIEEPTSAKTNIKVESSKDLGRPKSTLGSPTLKSKAEQFDVSEVEGRKIPKIVATLEAMKQHMTKLKVSKMPMELKNYDARCYPYLLSVLALGVSELHSSAMQLIISTLDHFDSCNDAYSQLISGLLDLFEYHHSVSVRDSSGHRLVARLPQPAPAIPS